MAPRQPPHPPHLPQSAPGDLPGTRGAAEELVSITIIMPTLNEASLIAQTLAHTRAVAGDAELLVVDGGSSDGTPALARPFAPVVSATTGRAAQMNAGARLARGDALLFLHADTLLPAGALDMIGDALSDGRVVGGAFALRFDEPGRAYERMGVATTRRSANGSYTGDQCIFVRSHVFWQLGGYPDLPIMEDVELSHRLRRVGPVRLIPTPVTTSARRHRACGLANVLLLCWRIRLLYALGVPAPALKRMYPDVR
jgi:rSAM/selenodomain-associated transferase 2